MSHKKVRRFYYGIYDDETKMIAAAKKLKKNNFSIYDFYTPCPVHGLDELIGLRRTRLPIVCFVAALTGVSLAILFQIWTSALDWPINVGGKPFISLPAFAPVAFEVMVLFGAFVSVFAFFFRQKLFPRVKTEVIRDRITNDKFVIALEEENASIDEELLLKVLYEFSPDEVINEEEKTR